VSEQSKIPVTTNGIADSLHGQGKFKIKIGGIGLAAQTLLSSTLAAIGNRSNLSWRLLYDASARTYELSLSGTVSPQ
jgi:hypothetical protein